MRSSYQLSQRWNKATFGVQKEYRRNLYHPITQSSCLDDDIFRYQSPLRRTSVQH
uniref:Uncharacterized protein n=1 Tax=Siphoviridae sp. ctNHg2 TaxID=2825467 RepID=A0A8S5V4A0_9CAUD|nr:MAG TPA: hypothetical protein [Siphoviridae sp. ctNHg2]